MLITNCQLILKDEIISGSVRVEQGKIVAIYTDKKLQQDKNEETIDAGGIFLAPGFIDIHVHGAAGYDTMDGTDEAIMGIAKAIAQHGTTSFLPTTMTVETKEVRKSLEVIKKLMTAETGGAQVLGAHLEGPFVSPAAVGAQNPKYVLEPSIKDYERMVGNYEEVVVSMTLAPELEGAEALIKYVADKGIICSIGHSKATYDEVSEAIKWGASHVTHLYNGMTPFTHREPGIVGAAFDHEITAEIIADGIHSTYPALRIAFKQKSTDNMILITDAMMACCMPEGQYALGGQVVYMKDEAARLENGVLAGSVLTLDKAVANVYKNCQLPLHEIVKMATYNPAKFCKIHDHKGLIKEGYDADLILLDQDLQIHKVWIKGKEMFSS